MEDGVAWVGQEAVQKKWGGEGSPASHGILGGPAVIRMRCLILSCLPAMETQWMQQQKQKQGCDIPFPD